jgi:hypothetical protein
MTRHTTGGIDPREFLRRSNRIGQILRQPPEWSRAFLADVVLFSNEIARRFLLRPEDVDIALARGALRAQAHEAEEDGSAPPASPKLPDVGLRSDPKKQPEAFDFEWTVPTKLKVGQHIKTSYRPSSNLRLEFTDEWLVMGLAEDRLRIRVVQMSPRLSGYLDVGNDYTLKQVSSTGTEVWEIPAEQMRKGTSQVLLSVSEKGKPEIRLGS